MTNLSAAAPCRVLGLEYSQKFTLDTSGAQTIYKGTPMIIDQSVDTLLAHSMESITCVDGDVFIGIAMENKTVASGAAETTEIECWVWPTIVGFKSAILTHADLGKPVYKSDTDVLTASNGAYPRIGKLHLVQDGYAYVAIDSPFVLDVP